jgi:hypothetical protein
MKTSSLLRFGVCLTFAILLFMSCKKKSSDPTPSTPANNTINNNNNNTTKTVTPPPLFTTFNGTNDTANTLITLTSYSSWYTATSPFSIDTVKGSYAAFTYNDNTGNYSYPGFTYSFVISQMNVVHKNNVRDTLVSEILISSSSPITTGSYQIWADTFYTTNPPEYGPTFATGWAYDSQMSNFYDSTTIGIITISKLDMTNKVASGSYSFINYGYKVNGVVPAITVANAQFTNMKIQTF